MKFSRPDSSHIVISQLERFWCELLRLISPTAEPGEHTAVEERFFPSPTEGLEEDLEEDWDDFVRPELQEHFASARDVVGEDLAAVTYDALSQTYTLTIPRRHLEAWVLALNQARIALATRAETGEPVPDAVLQDVPIAVPRLQSYLYDYLMDRLLMELKGD